jgi:hypothetical protein
VKNIFKSMISIAFAVGMTTAAHAQATRTWVSGVGDDVNPCSRTAPCKTFAGAISKTADKGEIDVLDPGGFGVVTITKNMTIDGAGTLAGVLSTGSPAGVNVNDSATATPNTIEVTLRNLNISCGATGTDGVRMVSGRRLTLDHVSIYNCAGDGVELLTTAGTGMFEMRNSSIENVNQGINAHPTNSGFVFVVSKSHIFRVNGTPGIDLNGPLVATISDSDVSNSTASSVQIRSTAQANLDHVRAVGSPFGVFNASGTPTTRLKDCVLVGTSTGAQNNAGTMNMFKSNVTNGTGGVIGSINPQ